MYTTDLKTLTTSFHVTNDFDNLSPTAGLELEY